MRTIEKIEIHRFRSISDVSVEVDEITIFSGINNSGKSNILRALNLFFTGKSSFGQKYDFERDYNKAFTGKAGGKRAIRIVLHFSNQGTAALKSPFSISRTFQIGQEDSELEYRSEDPDVQNSINKKDGNITRQFTRFLNKIEYFYIPAVREKEFVRSLFLHFEKLIEHDSGDDFKDKMEDLSQVLQKNSQEISTDFEKFIGLPTQANLSSKITDILGTVEVNVKTGIKILRHTKSGREPKDVYVNLFSSGDGILMSYLAYFLAHVCKKISNKTFIWGFEEPENSLEYSKAQQIAEDVFANFQKNAQIFITTHSPAFINLQDRNGVLFYRVFIKPDDTKQISEIRKLCEIRKKQQYLFNAGEVDSIEYKKLREELHLVEFAKEIEMAVKRVRDEERAHIDSRQKFEKKYQLLLQAQPSRIFICEDSSKDAIKLWEKWIKMFDISDVKVMTSEGCTQNIVETGVRHQQKLDLAYKPKVFRQIDRDGLTDEQIRVIQEEIFNKEKGFAYKSRFLPVNEIENFAVLTDMSFSSGDFWTTHENQITESFERTATDKLKLFDKKFGYDKPEFRGNGGVYTSLMQGMRKAARAEWKLFFPGKEICQAIQNFNPIKHLNALKKDDLPSELINYMKEIKAFYEEGEN